MQTLIKPAFKRDLSRLLDPAARRRARRAVATIQAAPALSAIPNLRRLRGGGGGPHHYRMRVGNYRLALTLDGDVAILERYLHRREIYRRFP